MQLYNHVVIEQQPFEVPIDLIIGHLAKGGAVGPLWCDDTSSVIMP